MTSQNPLSSPNPWTQVAEGYVTDTKPLFGQYCQRALELVGFDGTGKVLGVGIVRARAKFLLIDTEIMYSPGHQ